MTTTHWTTADIPDQSGRVAVVTGSNTGLGLETAQALAGAGAEVVMAVRNLDKGEAAKATILDAHPGATIHLQSLDLASLDSIGNAADEILGRDDRLDLLINNAGVMYTEWQTTSDGFEFQMGVNHLGHFALTIALLDRLMATEGSRVVNVSSVGHKVKSKLDPATMMSGDKYDRIAAYGRSKLANLLFTYELQRRLATAASTTEALVAHPGVSKTELGRNAPRSVQFMERFSGLFLQSAAQGALPQLRAATDPDATGGEYYGPDGFMEGRGNPVVVTSSPRSHDEQLQTALWAASERLTGVTSPI
jgi:NAD(P)-dependent dehydrogenase (short-subunit alcohol dehydrogenase family)